MVSHSYWNLDEKPLKVAHFFPAVGRNYDDSSFGLKIMLLGESHYWWEKTPKDESQTTIASIQQGFDKKAFWKQLRGLFPDDAGRSSEGSEDDFWSHVLFYNYVQRLLPNVHERPTRDDWAESIAGFREVLSVYQPARILVIGKTTWKSMPGRKELPKQSPIEESRFSLTGSLASNLDASEKFAVWYPTAADTFALAAPIFHPRHPKGFYADDTKEVVQQLLRKDWTSPLAKAS